MATATLRKKSPIFSPLRSKRAREPNPTACSLRAVYRPACPISTIGSTPSEAMQGFETRAVNIVATDATALRGEIEDVDAIVLLHSTNGDTTEYLEPFASVLADRRVPLLSFVGNEVNLPGSPISAKRRLFARIRPDWIATQLLEEAGDSCSAMLSKESVIAIPHALNPECFPADALASMSGRPILERGCRAICPILATMTAIVWPILSCVLVPKVGSKSIFRTRGSTAAVGRNF